MKKKEDRFGEKDIVPVFDLASKRWEFNLRLPNNAFMFLAHARDEAIAHLPAVNRFAAMLPPNRLHVLANCEIVSVWQS